jgi:hypothetical protein
MLKLPKSSQVPKRVLSQLGTFPTTSQAPETLEAWELDVENVGNGSRATMLFYQFNLFKKIEK